MLNLKYDVDIEAIRLLYERDGLTFAEIGKMVAVPERTIFRYLVKAGAAIRKKSDPKIKPLADREWLESHYIGQGLSTPQIAKILDCEPRSVWLWLSRHGIPTRTVGSEPGHTRNDSPELRQAASDRMTGRFMGPEHWNYKGGPERRDPERTRMRARRWADQVKDRDGRKCVECGSTDRLHAHHIVRWRDRPDLRYELSNGKTLCYSCHEQVHGPILGSRRFKQAKKSTSTPALK